MPGTMLRALLFAATLFGQFAGPARAKSPKLSFEFGEIDVRMKISAAVQAAVVDSSDTGEPVIDQAVDVKARMTASWTSPGGVVFGARGELTNRERDVDPLDNGEVYAFAETGFGRVEVGLQDGPADSLAISAPVIALGQIRGDFARYAGARALLRPLDTRDAFKVIYVSPLVGGVRAGISWSPRVRQNQDQPNPQSRILLRDAVELGIQFHQSVDDWVIGVGGSFAFGRADPITTRAGLNSWSAGIETRRGPLHIGAAFVERGDSNRLDRGFDQRELNGGVAWVERRWGVAVSGARSKAKGRSNTVAGLGGFYTLNPMVQIRSDIIHFREARDGMVSDNGLVGLIALKIEI